MSSGKKLLCCLAVDTDVCLGSRVNRLCAPLSGLGQTTPILTVSVRILSTTYLVIKNLVWESCFLKFPEKLKLCVTTPIHFLRCRLPGTLNCHSTSAVFLYFIFFSKKKQSVRPSAWDLMQRQRNRCQKSDMTLVNSDDTSSRL